MFLDYPHLANKVYTLNLDVSGNYMKKVLKDERVGLTVVEVVRLFFKVLENVVIYVCDNLDNRQLARMRKFDLWFKKYNDGEIVKRDDLAVFDGVEIYNSLLVHRTNKNLDQIIDAFSELNSRNIGDK